MALDPVVLRADAMRNHSIYRTYGISVFAEQDLTLDELAQLPPIVGYEQPTRCDPRHYGFTFDNLNDGVSKLENFDRELVINPCHGG